MGCDIHAHIEAKEYESFYRQAYVHLTRNYLMFGLMAGVRKDIAMIAPRGLPTDISTTVRWEHREMELDAHTSSFLTADEFEQVLKAYEADGSWGGTPPIYKATLALMRELGDTARIVFWFDN